MHKQSAIESTLAITAAVIGAGFASGREIIQFFSRFGAASWWGIITASLTIGGIAYLLMTLFARYKTDSFPALCAVALGRIGGRVASVLYLLLLVCTAGAMASGIGEIAALTIRVQGVYWIGLLLGTSLCGWMAWRGISALTTGGSFLIPVCLILFIVLARLPANSYTLAQKPLSSWWAIPLGLCYAAMNGSLCCGLFGEIGRASTWRMRAAIAVYLTLIMAMLLGSANQLLLPHARRLQLAPLPMVVLAHQAGFGAVLLCIVALLLAMGTTLSAALRATAQRLPVFGTWGYILSAALAAILGAIGFNRIIGLGYPLLGWGCAVVLAALCVRGLAGSGSGKGTWSG